jgi:hypothetical protein
VNLDHSLLVGGLLLLVWLLLMGFILPRMGVPT